MDYKELHEFISTELNFCYTLDVSGKIESKNLVDNFPQRHKYDTIFIEEPKYTITDKINILDRWGFILMVHKNNQDSVDFLLKYKSQDSLIMFNYIKDENIVTIIFKGFNNHISDKELEYNLDSLLAFVRKRKTKPSSITLAFIGGAWKPERDLLISETKKNYNVDVWSKDSKYGSTYSSFSSLTYSQLINESVMDAKSEFIVWLGSKSKANFDMIDELLLLVCSGYCWASEFNVSVTCSTKQLFRKIGMYDERFIGGEMEDVDWYFRMKYHDIAFFERGNEEAYPPVYGTWQNLRGIAHNVFHEKWIELNPDLGSFNFGKDFTLSKFYTEEKNYRDGIERKDIESSWERSTNNHAIHWIAKLGSEANFHENNYLESYRLFESQIHINLNPEDTYVSFNCEGPAFMFMTVHDMNGSCLLLVKLNSNWYQKPNPVFYSGLDFVEVRINIGGRRVYHNLKFDVRKKLDLSLGIKVKVNQKP